MDGVVLANILRRMQRRLERLATRVSDVVDDADRLAVDMEHLVRRLAGVSEVVPRLRITARARQDDGVMRAEAEAGASSLEIARRTDGRGDVRLNGRRPFAVPPRLATLLAVLRAGAEDSDDGLLGWRTNQEIATALNAETGGTLAARAVPRLVFKLRRVFFDAGENGHLIQTNRKRGVRLAVRR